MEDISDRMRNFWKPTDIYTSQRLTLYLLMFTGFFPFQISGNSYNRYLRVSVFGYVMSFLFIVLFTVFFYLVLKNISKVFDVFHDALLAKFSGSLKFFTIMSMMILIYGSCLCLKKKITTCMAKIVSIDKKLNFIGIEINYWNGFYFSIEVISFLAVHFTATLTLNYFLNKAITDGYPDLIFPMWTSFFTNHLPLVAMTVIEIYYACIAFEIRKRFEAMNQVSFYALSGKSINRRETCCESFLKKIFLLNSLPPNWKFRSYKFSLSFNRDAGIYIINCLDVSSQTKLNVKKFREFNYN